MEPVTSEAANLIEKTLRILENHVLCDRCLGRFYAMLGRGVSNVERGRAVKLTLLMALHARYREGDTRAKEVLEKLVESLYTVSPLLYEELGVKPRGLQCYICGGLFERLVDDVSKRVARMLKEYDAETFLIGVRLDEVVRRKEQELVMEYGLSYAESIASELKREIGKKVQSYGFRVDFENPDIVVLVDYPAGNISFTINPVLIYGRYYKLGRRVSQSSWITRMGVKRYPFSVQDAYIPLLELYEGVEIVIHAAGREDVDVRMLGSGRPIVVEIKEPRRRRVDILLAARKVNEKWEGLFESQFEARVKRSFVRVVVKGEEGEERHSKIYRALVYVPEGVSPEELRKLEEFFQGRLVRQRTPRRVRHRRADVIRERRVYSVKTQWLSDTRFIALIHAEGGLYIKELVSGEDTWPGFPDALGKQSYCTELDVLYVESRLRLKKGLVEAGGGGGEYGKATQGLPTPDQEAAQEAYT